MSQHDMTIANDTRTNVRTDIQSALQALASTSKGNSRPSTVYAGQLWIDDNTPSSTVWTLNLYDGSDDIPLGFIDTTNNGFAVQLGMTSRFFQATTDTPGFSNTTTGGALEKNAQGAALFLSRSAFAPLWLNVNTDDVLLAAQRSGTTVGGIAVTSSTTSFVTSSDRRAKHLKHRVSDAVRRLCRIEVWRATFKTDKRQRVHDVFVADQLQAVAPYAVTGKKNGATLQQVDYGKLTPLLVAALQDALAAIADLKARVAELEARANG